MHKCVVFVRDSGFSDINRFLLYKIKKMNNYLNKTDVWLIDGTFKSVCAV